MNKSLLYTGLVMTIMYGFNLVTELFVENVEFTDYIMPVLALVLFLVASKLAGKE